MIPLFSVRDAVLRDPQLRFSGPVSLTLEYGEQLAIVGENGGGKSILASLVTGSYPLLSGTIEYDFSPVYDHVKLIAFRDSYGPADASYYLQQRWHSQDCESSPVVREKLGDYAKSALYGVLFRLFGIDEMLDKPMVLLSSGELRKVQLVRALLSGPSLLIIDKPFIGLDTETRSQLSALLEKLVDLQQLQLILLLSKTDEIPGFITHIVPVNGRCCGSKIPIRNYQKEVPAMPQLPPFCPPSICPIKETMPDRVIDMEQVTIRYGQRTILKNLDWHVKCGEKWAVLGQNGAGKSTLLSLICADNPQAYACNMSLFGHKRGTGESIWEIKKHIGYVSPEMHRAYSADLPAADIVASGLHDSVGLYVKPRPEQRHVCSWWMDMFGITHLQERSFLRLSDGEQRLVLLARAFVKNPGLLILDEPMHGLDDNNRLRVRTIIDAFCRQSGKTLIMVTHYQEELPACITNRLLLRREE